MTVHVDEDGGRSVTDPDTHFTILRTSRNRPTSELQCDECDATGRGLEDIDHDQDCSQANIR
ncbi:hypothetical protein [Haloarchaeobius sp. HRN-SO-5]|uniref:hypothetical protein n=1 Tax=Haloarchaeobius sp. HRN-SO-5 TaxID=3446118 RepID=UPI003EB69D8A